MIKILKYFMGLLFVLCISCNNESFTPYSELENKMISYSVFDTRLDTQYVKIQSSYLYDQNMKPDKNLKIYLSEESGGTYIYQKVPDDLKSKYANYYLPGFKPKRGRNYKLTVLNDSIAQYAEISIPEVVKVKIDMRLDTIYSYGQGGGGKSSLDITVRPTFRATVPSSAPKTNVLKFYIEYEKTINGKMEKGSIEIPVGGQAFTNPEFWEFTTYNNFWLDYTVLYDPLKQKTYSEPSTDWSKVYYKNSGNDHALNIPFSCLIYTLDQIGQGCDPKDVTIKGCYAIFYGIDDFYFDKYCTTREEEYSVRLDVPFYSSNFKNNNDKNPIGFFTWVTTDTVRFNMIYEPISILKFNDGQKK